MRQRPAIAAMLFGVGLAVSGCAQGYDAMDGVQNAMHNFNPFGANQKALPGDRKPVFPEGVPGVQQGVPDHLMPGAREPEVLAATPAPAEEPVAAETRRPQRTAARPRPAESSPPPRARQEQPSRQAARPQPQRQAPAARAAATQPPADAVWPAPPRSAASAPASDPVWPAPPQASAPPSDTVWPDPAQAAPRQPQRSAPRQAQTTQPQTTQPQSAQPQTSPQATRTPPVQGGWAPPPAEPVPTVWPDPPQ